MKRIKLILSMLLAALLLPTSLLAQTESEVETITSTFTKFGTEDFYLGESWSYGPILTTEGNDWFFYGAGNPVWPTINEEASGFALSLNKQPIYLRINYNLSALLKKIIVRTGGNLGKIEVEISSSDEENVVVASVTPTSKDLQDYEIDLGDGQYVSNIDGKGNRHVQIVITPIEDASGYDATLLESIKLDVIRENRYFQFGGRWVSNLNCNDIKVKGLKSGKVSFNLAEATLTLDNVVYDGTGLDVYQLTDNVVYNQFNKIELIGDNVFTNTNCGFAIKGRTILGKGSGASLSVSGEYYQLDTGAATIDNCSVTLTSAHSEALSCGQIYLINNASLLAKTLSESADIPALFNYIENGFILERNMSILPENIFIGELNDYISATSSTGDTWNHGNGYTYYTADTHAMVKEVFMGDPSSYGVSGTVGNLSWKVEKIEGASPIEYYYKGEYKTAPPYRLIISGEGKMQSFDSVYGETNAPWAKFQTITKVVINEGVTSIGFYAFYGLNMIEEVSLPHSLKSIGGESLRGNKISKIDLPEGLEEIGSFAFTNCPIETIVIPSTVKGVYSFAFGGCPLKSIIVAKENTTLDSRNDCNAVIITATNELMLGCVNTVIPKDVVSIGMAAFYSIPNLNEFVVPENVTILGRYAFGSCSNLETLIIGSGVTFIDNYAFNSLNKLTDIYCTAAPDKLTWEGYNDTKCCKSDGTTQFHVTDPAAWKAKFPDAHVQFVAIGSAETEKGDASGDDVVDAKDVVALMNYLAGSKPEGFNEAAADVNGDGKIDIADIVALVNLLLSKE